MAQERLREHRQGSRARLIAGAVAAAYVAFAVFAQLIGEDESEQTDTLRLNAFCTALYSDYPELLSTVANEGEAFGPLADTEGGRQFYGSFIDTDLAPEEFRDDVDHLAVGLDRAINGELTPAEVQAYIRDYEDLRDAATPTCDEVGRELQVDVDGP